MCYCNTVSKCLHELILNELQYIPGPDLVPTTTRNGGDDIMLRILAYAFCVGLVNRICQLSSKLIAVAI